MDGNIHESIRLFVMCESMKWAHLPLPGGLYAQHPRLLDDFFYIFQVRAAHEASEAAKEKAKAANKKPSTSARATRGRRRR